MRVQREGDHEPSLMFRIVSRLRIVPQPFSPHPFRGGGSRQVHTSGRTQYAVLTSAWSAWLDFVSYPANNQIFLVYLINIDINVSIN
jgi:hypothetical protein